MHENYAWRIVDPAHHYTCQMPKITSSIHSNVFEGAIEQKDLRKLDLHQTLDSRQLLSRKKRNQWAVNQ